MLFEAVFVCNKEVLPNVNVVDKNISSCVRLPETVTGRFSHLCSCLRNLSEQCGVCFISQRAVGLTLHGRHPVSPAPPVCTAGLCSVQTVHFRARCALSSLVRGSCRLHAVRCCTLPLSCGPAPYARSSPRDVLQRSAESETDPHWKRESRVSLVSDDAAVGWPRRS